jgi:putative ABC transport system substrate-binding protein
MPAQYVKAYVKRNKNDAADAEAICEAVRRPTMRFVPIKTAEQQAVHRGRERLVRQRTALVNALRARLATIPGIGPITGFTFVNPELISKCTSLLKEAAPGVNRAVLLYSPRINPFYPNLLRELEATPQSLALEVASAAADTVDDLLTTIEALARTPGTSLIIGPDGFMIVHIRKVAELAAANRLPGISVYRQFAVEGGLMSYGPDTADIFRRSAGYVDRILKGANPAELPVQEPTKFEFVINQKTAGGLGLVLSPTLLAGADEVIE